MLQILGYLISTIHLLLHFFAFIGTYISDNIYSLTLIILWYTLTLFSWYTLGQCAFSNLEQSLTGKQYKYKDGNRKSFITNLFEYIIPNKNVAFWIITSVPLINITVSLWRINKIYYSDNKNKKLPTSKSQN